MTTVRIVPLHAGPADRTTFDCGNPELNDWLRMNASQNERLNRTRTFLLVTADHDQQETWWYFTLVNYQIPADHAAIVLNRPSRYPMPGTLLARLAIARTSQGKGYGKIMLRDALNRVFATVSLDPNDSKIPCDAARIPVACVPGTYSEERLMSTHTKDARIQLRVSADAKAQIAAAAAVTQQDTTSFILDAATTRARAVLLETKVLTLSPDEIRSLQDAFNDDSGPHPALVKLFQDVENDPRWER